MRSQVNIPLYISSEFLPGNITTRVCVCMCAQLQPVLCTPVDCSLPGSSVHGDFPGKNTGVGCHALLQGIFPTQGWNLCLLHLPALSGRFFITEPAGSPKQEYTAYQKEYLPHEIRLEKPTDQSWNGWQQAPECVLESNGQTTSLQH